ncbi:hypothetical protein C8R43DRAFT_1068876 [Mycena crocata]|nr:hypothetical protein C8R43DRAFT_1068876 [Mycena crocata]
MFYAILGDTKCVAIFDLFKGIILIYESGDGVITEVTGEASLFLAQTCFPNDGINGDSGHGEPDVAYIVFGDQVPDGVEDTTIDLDALKFLGDQQVRLLQEALSGAGPNASSVATPSPSTSSKHHAAPSESSSAGDDF